MDKVDVLKGALEHRVDEIQHYQINIDNFTRAIAKIKTEYSSDSRLGEFLTHLEDNLKASKLEQLKAKIIHDVIKEQLIELGEL